MRTLALLLAATLAQAQPTAECDRGGLLTPRGIGPLAIGITDDSLARVCRIVSRDVVDGSTVLAVRVGRDTVRAFADPVGRIAWIEVDSPRILTRDSLGVGSSAASILHLQDVSGDAGGTNMFALSSKSGPHCGLTFWLDARTAEMLNAARGDRLRLLGMRGGGTVIQVDIHGECRDGRGE
jgi:hypothetical protein